MCTKLCQQMSTAASKAVYFVMVHRGSEHADVVYFAEDTSLLRVKGVVPAGSCGQQGT